VVLIAEFYCMYDKLLVGLFLSNKNAQF